MKMILMQTVYYRNTKVPQSNWYSAIRIETGQREVFAFPDSTADNLQSSCRVVSGLAIFLRMLRNPQKN